MQKKLESFFKPSSRPKFAPPISNSFEETRADKQPEIRIKYTRKATTESDQFTRGGESTSDGDGVLVGEETVEEQRGEGEKLKVVAEKGKVLNKKRSYAQLHLELGQSDFLLHTCKTCGFSYAKGDEVDEKVHGAFHKNFILGISFKGWRHERVIQLASLEKKDRIILVLNCDPPAQKKKVQEVVKMMEIELGEGWIYHELCKVYMFISSQRVAGCIIVEPIDTAHKVLLNSMNQISDSGSGKEAISKPTILQFGEICFQRELSRKSCSRKSLETTDFSLGSIVCEEEATPASCGVRAIWVSPSNRRKHIATHLLDAVRKSFCADYVLEPSQLAFSQPTSAGKALASKYTGTGSFLVYKS